MEWLIGISTLITALATIAIAYFAKTNSDLTAEIINQEKNFHEHQEALIKQHQKELSDLYQAITIATLMGGSSNTGVVEGLIKTFKNHYSGSIKIFKD